MMKLNINDLFSTNFSVSAEGAGLMKELRRNLGFESNYEVARLAIGLSMGQKNYPDNHRSGSAGSIRGNILFDKHDYPLWVGILLTNYINHHPEEIDNISMPMLQAVVKAHWDNGLFLLHDIWEQSNQNQHRFWEIILGKYVDLPNTDQYIHPHLDNSTMRPSSGAIKLVIGNMLINSEEVEIYSHELNRTCYTNNIDIFQVHWLEYPEITSEKFLELICVMMNCGFEFSGDIENSYALKRYILETLCELKTMPLCSCWQEIKENVKKVFKCED